MKTTSPLRSPTIALASLLLMVSIARADDFMALPGLWKTTLHEQPADDNGKPSAQVQWHCVDEDADPWIEFAQLPDPLPESCKRTSYERTATTLKWRLDCSAPAPVTNSGSIVFDSPLHYTGTVTMSGSLLNYPLHSSIRIEGEHLAACTSPKD